MLLIDAIVPALLRFTDLQGGHWRTGARCCLNTYAKELSASSPCTEHCLTLYCFCREAIGVPELTAPPNTYDLLNKRWCSPSLSIVDIRTTTSSNSSSATTTAGPGGSSSSSKPGGLREYAHTAAAVQRSSSNPGGGSFSVVQQQGGRLGGCVHGSHGVGDCGNLWPSVVSVTHTEKHGAAEVPSYAGAGGADDRSCYRFGPTRFSVIPKVAVGKISLRFVPEQDHQTLIECLQQHIEKRFKLLWSANRVELQVRCEDVRLPIAGAAYAQLRCGCKGLHTACCMYTVAC
jgi:hypothetical protein